MSRKNTKKENRAERWWFCNFSRHARLARLPPPQEFGGTQGHVFTQSVAIQPYLARMVVSLPTDERQHIVCGAIPIHEQQARLHIEVYNHRILLLLLDRQSGGRLGHQQGRCGIGPPIHRVNNNRTLVPKSTTGIAHRVVANRDPLVGGSLGRPHRRGREGNGPPSLRECSRLWHTPQPSAGMCRHPSLARVPA